jgi:hypothetical protein
MSIRRKHREAIEALGYTVEERFVHLGTGPEWQTVLKQNNKTVAVIVTQGCHTDNRLLYNRYQLRRKGKPTEIYKLKREAIAAWAKSLR